LVIFDRSYKTNRMMNLKKFYSFGALFCLGLSFEQAKAQEVSTYQMPPESIATLVDAPTVPSVQWSNSGKYILYLERSDFPTIDEVAQPVLGLAGLRLNPMTNGSAVVTLFTSLRMRNASTSETSLIQGLPAQPLISNITWSPDERFIAFTNSTSQGMELWLVDSEKKSAHKWIDNHVNDAYGATLQWHPNSQSILFTRIPSDRGVAPKEPIVPTGPIIQENMGKAAPSRTYQNLLKNEFDAQLMDHYLLSELVQVQLDGQIKTIGPKAIYRSFNYSPDGNYLLVSQVKRPYSYLVPISSFPFETMLWSQEGKAIKSLHLSPLAESTPIGFDAVSPGLRSISWRPDRPATLFWVEALDGGDPRRRVALRDAVFEWSAPFEGEKQHLISTQWRYSGIHWSDQEFAILNERWWQTRTQKLTLFNSKTGDTIQTISHRLYENTYTDPGSFVTQTNAFNRSVLLLEKSKQPTVFTIGTGSSPEGDRPFLMKWNLITGKQDTLFKSKAPYYEMPVRFTNNGQLIISRESVEEAPNYYRVNLKNRKLIGLTDFPDPYPTLQGVQKQQLSYQREDGLTLSGTLYLPKDYTAQQGPLPMLMWAYPREFKSVEAASQIKGSPYRFTRISWGSPIYWVTRGYAVLDNADMPIVGEGDQLPNDTFVQQLKDNAKAAIDHVVQMGVVDRQRIGVGGHSYGAFMTAHLLAHTDLFAAGLARSGAYNRTFTPFGFQQEERTYWQAPEVYYTLSPFSYADKIKTPILLIHGMDDENSGTFPIQSERFYNAIKGHGGTTRLVMLPKEFHGYRAKESIMHTLWEMDQWLEKFVKNRSETP
jgi:dipeptidyl aminopeptidase/acylaminoacyl peptidase